MNIILTIQYMDNSVPLSLLLISTWKVWRYQRRIQPEAENWRRTDNSMSKTKRTKWQTM